MVRKKWQLSLDFHISDLKEKCKKKKTDASVDGVYVNVENCILIIIMVYQEVLWVNYPIDLNGHGIPYLLIFKLNLCVSFKIFGSIPEEAYLEFSSISFQ